jgi:transcription elongation factor SPT6
LTEDDDLIRAQDIPERMQLANSSLLQSSTLSLSGSMTEADISEASFWITPRLSLRKSREFFRVDGQHWGLQTQLVEAVQNALRFIFIQEFEVPYIWTHKRDYISHFDVNDLRARVELLNLGELWRIYTLGQKYRSLSDRRKALDGAFERLGINDEYYEQEIRPKIDTVEMVGDATEWLTMKYKDHKQDRFVFHFHDDEEQSGAKKQKKPSRISTYEVTKKSVVSKLAKVRSFYSCIQMVISLCIGLRYPSDRDCSELCRFGSRAFRRGPGLESDSLRGAIRRSGHQ